MRNLISIFMLVVILMTSASCATPGSAVRGPSADLRESVVGYYESIRDMNFAAAWTFERMSTHENPETRENMRSTYLGRMGKIRTTSYEILEIGEEGSGTGGFTPVVMRFRGPWPNLPMPMPEGERVWEMSDLWEKIDGKWYHVVVAGGKFW